MKRFLTLSLVLTLTAGAAYAQQRSSGKQKEDAQEVTVEVIAETSNSWDGKELPNYPATTPKITMLRYIFPPHVKLDPHRHFIINCGVMLKGELTIVTLDGREKTFRAGDAIVEMIGDAHYGENRGDEPAEVIMFYAGTEGLTLKEELK